MKFCHLSNLDIKENSHNQITIFFNSPKTKTHSNSNSLLNISTAKVCTNLQYFLPFNSVGNFHFQTKIGFFQSTFTKKKLPHLY
jgi:hypothetical protein